MSFSRGIRPHTTKVEKGSFRERISGWGLELPNLLVLSIAAFAGLFIVSVGIGAGVGKWSAMRHKQAPAPAAEAMPSSPPLDLKSGLVFGMRDPLNFLPGDSLSTVFDRPSLWDVENDGGSLKRYTYIISQNDNLYSSLQCFGVSRDLILSWTKLAKGTYNLEKLKPGQSFFLWATPDKEFVKFEFNIDDQRRLVIAKEGEEYRAYEESRDVPTEAVGGEDHLPVPAWVDPDTGLHYYRGEVKSSFYDSATRAGMTESKVMALVRVFGGVNFGQLEEGARFSVVVAPGERADEEGPILAAMIEVRNQPRYIFRFDDNGRTGYFNEKGKSAQSSSLICPVRYTRISSYYTYRRFHPILKRYRPHLGVDYAAPAGTPVRAAASGKVISVGWRKGFGRTIRIRHNGVYETQYAHLSRYGKGLQKGRQVRQGQVIGHVGSTGSSTGPHLDYRVYRYGNPINPLRVTGMPGPPVKDIPGFENQKKSLLAELDRDLPLGPPLPWPLSGRDSQLARASE